VSVGYFINKIVNQVYGHRHYNPFLDGSMPDSRSVWTYLAGI
jgi:hypothetical protein